ncbi:DUF4188 domain-containing protein [Sutcliffiella horikoshii]|uniref:DUF4188 domain-containing protein n=1 Tax=Sutcliffiella horikoshii TaxID=79883 RepID=UPI001F30B39A|nr:DUF4188 domain-containing protein [Sutcliffiella horikoshii]MCG1023746.1 DUF4188 domain-containing protein [Sutcliffiella horikoshii]
MSAEIFPGRYTVENQEDIVVFTIGMRINKWWAIHKWFPVFKAMPPMIRELYMNKDLGCLSMEHFYSLRTTLLLQYWRSEEDLMAYAKGQKHLKAWNEFNKKIGNNDAVGIYHETFLVKQGNYESVYGNMPKFGLGKVFGISKITKKNNTFKKRVS